MSEMKVSNNATRIVASTFGILAGLLGIEHGYFETLQGNGVPGGIYILAIALHARRLKCGTPASLL